MRVDIGCVPIVWNNVDLPDLGPPVPYEVVLDELAGIGFAGTQFGCGFPEGQELRAALAQRSLRLAEWYVSLPVTDDGLATDAERVAGNALERLVAADGEVLCVAVDGSEVRDTVSGRVDGTAPRWPDAAFVDLAGLLDRLVDEAPDNVRVAFHPHVGSWVEAPGEVDALTEALALSGGGAGLCLDVGHYTVGGGDPVDAIRRHAPLIRHVHAKDVDPAVLDRVRSGELTGMWPMIRERIFTELGHGVLDLPGVVAALDDIGYDGWIMVEQDSSWLPPAEASAIGMRALRAALEAVAA
jgi:inosose dehydratase